MKWPNKKTLVTKCRQPKSVRRVSAMDEWHDDLRHGASVSQASYSY